MNRLSAKGKHHPHAMLTPGRHGTVRIENLAVGIDRGKVAVGDSAGRLSGESQHLSLDFVWPVHVVVAEP